MTVRDITVHDFKYENALGAYVGKATISITPDELKIYANTLDWDIADYSININEIMRIEREIAIQFLNDNLEAILDGKRILSVDERDALNISFYKNKHNKIEES